MSPHDWANKIAKLAPGNDATTYAAIYDAVIAACKAIEAQERAHAKRTLEELLRAFKEESDA